MVGPVLRMAEQDTQAGKIDLVHLDTWMDDLAVADTQVQVGILAGIVAAVYMGRSGGTGKDVVVAVDIETAGELLADRTMFFSPDADSSQRSTESKKKAGSIWLCDASVQATHSQSRATRHLLCWYLLTSGQVCDDNANARWWGDGSSVLQDE